MKPNHHRAAATVVAAALACGGCAFSPLNHHIDVGNEPFVIFVGEGIDHNTDLFAVPAGGGEVAQVTFTPLVERDPRLSPHGEVVAFIRMRDTLPDAPHNVVLMNLIGGGELTVPLPPSAGSPQAIAWSPDVTQLYIRTDRALWSSTVPPGKLVVHPVPAADSAAADSALDLWVGQPRFARVTHCQSGLCAITARTDTTALTTDGRDPIRWGADSVGWFANGTITVRSLGAGVARQVNWHNPPANPRDASYATGVIPKDSL